MGGRMCGARNHVHTIAWHYNGIRARSLVNGKAVQVARNNQTEGGGGKIIELTKTVTASQECDGAWSQSLAS